MKNIKIWQITTILIFLVQSAYSQSRNYIATDSTMKSGVRLIMGTAQTNAQFILVRMGGMEIKYSPDQLTEYGFKDGPVYKSKNISVSGQPKRVFLERIEHGKLTLYYYTEKGFKTFFLEKDSTVFVELQGGDNFRTPIIENTNDFEWKASQVQLAQYNKISLSRLISMYNNGNNRPLPYPRFGITAGYSRMSLTLPETMTDDELDGITFTPCSSVSFGVFTDLPIKMSDFSFNAGVNFSKYGFTANSKTSQSDVDVVVNITSANLPILLRYTLPTLVWRPFINAGGICSYFLKYEKDIYEATFDQNEIIIKEVKHESYSSEAMLGYSLGIGLQRNLDYRKISSLEIRYNYQPGNEDKFNMSLLEVLVSFTF